MTSTEIINELEDAKEFAERYLGRAAEYINVRINDAIFALEQVDQIGGVKKLKVNAEIINSPKEVKHQWVVARRDSRSAELWWWGSYDDEEYAYSVAQEIGNGIVLEKEDVE